MTLTPCLPHNPACAVCINRLPVKAQATSEGFIAWNHKQVIEHGNKALSSLNAGNYTAAVHHTKRAASFALYLQYGDKSNRPWMKPGYGVPKAAAPKRTFKSLAEQRRAEALAERLAA